MNQKGFEVLLEIAEEGSFQLIDDALGQLPPFPVLADCLKQWQQSYAQLPGQTRITLHSVTIQTALPTQIEICRQYARELQSYLNTWLKSETFREIDTCLREILSPDEPIRVLIRTNDARLHHLPWHAWEFLERRPNAEFSLSTPPKRIQSIPKLPSIAAQKVRVLAILGDNTGIDTNMDRSLLEDRSDADVFTLISPSRHQISQQLWEQPWDILFFAGHSQTEESQGRIYINSQESLTLNELKYGLEKAIAQGLQLAIFNSCDGLGLAYELEQLHIPQLIVMREPVPDRVAQSFLEYFLIAYTTGESFYLAERRARQRLERWEGEFPCATWLPIIFQNPTVLPPTWTDLAGALTIPEIPSLLPVPLPSIYTKHPIRTLFVISLAAMMLVMGLRFTGLLQSLELNAFDHLMRMRSSELIDPRLLIVEATDEDTSQQGYPLSDVLLAQAIETLEEFKPIAIGLDMHRHQPRPIGGSGRKQLIDGFQRYPNLITVCSFDTPDQNFAPPVEFLPEQLRNQVGFSDLLLDDEWDGTGTIRRTLLSYDPALSSKFSTCTTPFSFSFQMAFRFLYAERKPLTVNEQGIWQSNKVSFTKLAERTGGYQQLDGESSQTLINYRSPRKSEKIARTITLKDVLSKRFDPSWVTQKIVLMGYTSATARDNFNTPYGRLSGVWIHAHSVSQILSAVMDHRPLIWVLPQAGKLQWGDALWVWGWAMAGSFIAYFCWRSPTALICLSLVATGMLYQMCVVLLTQGGWIPFIPSVLALCLAEIWGSYVVRKYK